MVALALTLPGCGGREPPPPSGRVALGDSIIELWPLEGIRNCGASGERTDEIAQRLDECARAARVMLVQGGINDLAQGRPVADAARNLRAMVRRAKAKGLRVVLAEVLPWNRGAEYAAPLIRDLNRRIAAIAREERVRLVPLFKAIEDPANPDHMRAQDTSDGDHPSESGYERLEAVLDLH